MKIKSGDTLSQIAKANGMTLKALLGANPQIKNANQIRVGQTITIPPKAMLAGSASKNPYEGMTRNERAALAEDTKENRARLNKQKETGKSIPRNPNSRGNKAATRATAKLAGDVKDRGSRTTANKSKTEETIKKAPHLQSPSQLRERAKKYAAKNRR